VRLVAAIALAAVLAPVAAAQSSSTTSTIKVPTCTVGVKFAGSINAEVGQFFGVCDERLIDYFDFTPSAVHPGVAAIQVANGDRPRDVLAIFTTLRGDGNGEVGASNAEARVIMAVAREALHVLKPHGAITEIAVLGDKGGPAVAGYLGVEDRPSSGW
jgi:hypothetical protein